MTDATCLLADDHPVLRAALEAFLVDAGYAVVASAPDGHRAVAAATTEQPDLALVDLQLPQLGGLDLIRAIREVSRKTRVVVYPVDIGEADARDLLADGVAGVVLKEAPLADLGRALKLVLHGSSYLDPGVSRSVRAAKLTVRERQVLSLLAEGLQHEQIAQQLGISAETVRTHLKKASDRLGATTRTQAVAAALRLGLIN